MPSIEDKLRFFAVKVNNGSGVIFQPNTTEYTYILSVKHNVEKEDKSILDIGDIIVKRNNEEIVVVNQAIAHENLDLIILIVPYIGNPNFILTTSEPIRDEELNIFGYPDYLKTQLIKTTNLVCKCGLAQVPNISYEITSNNPMYSFNRGAQQNVIGFSGSGIFKINGENLILKGIFPRLNDPEGAHSKINGLYIAGLNEIIRKNGLLELLPDYMCNFSFLKNDAFALQAGFASSNIEFTKNFLISKTQDVINSTLTPNEIKNLFKNRLVLFNQDESFLQSRGIWILWLEFLTILNIVKKENYTIEKIKEIFNNIRLISVDGDGDWSDQLTNMVYSDYRGLKKDGIVIIGISKPPADDETYILDKRIPHIANAIKDNKKSHDRGLLQIDDGISFPLEDYKFIHIEYFKKKSIIKKHAQYADILDDDVLLQKLIIEYKILIEDEQKYN
ncbi:ABC-three component system protein [Flavobacterium degerlachei]|jgi:hypothetical protein|uniref:ABC-three component systems C-terminal domain-containing protein n=1 Tax=Flavobacterium degerlachei TaxID=229203 RepID=A0A1H3CG37_9FLAO|nr:ABC-three component system protein [Flavobacterium degerlachei]SDX52554.1 hypothetical protein SAMN05444338_11195 [Flavobacterium degerlachei]